MGVSYYWAKKIADHVLGSQTLTVPATVYLALYTVAPTANGGGTEVSGGSYARVAVTNNNTNWPDCTLGVSEKTLGLAQAFAEATANWGTIVAFGLFDAASAGNLLLFGNLTTPQAITTGDIFRFPAGTNGITVSVT